MKTKMLDDKFILKDLAILGQWSVYFGGPNTGKTLLTFWLLIEAIKEGVIKGEDVFYMNADDTYKGSVEKLEMAEKYNFKMLLPNVNGFKVETLLSTMNAMTEQGEAKGKIIICDTLKKAIDLMSKKMSSEFGKVAREFVSAGGSIIALAHVNKHKNDDGKSIHTGTADISDDSDCVYIVEVLNKSDGFCNTVTTVEFQNKKARGDVAQSVAFQYTKEKGAGYQGLFDSVKRITKDSADVVLQEAAEAKQAESDSNTIEQIKAAIFNGVNSKTKIEEFVTSVSDIPHRKIRSVLKKYEGRLWIAERGIHNKLTYRFNTPPVVTDNVVSFF